MLINVRESVSKEELNAAVVYRLVLLVDHALLFLTKKTFNLPFKRIAGASLKTQGAGTGDIALALHPEDRIGWAHLWPHQRAWHVTQPQPTLRCVPESAQVGELLLNLWRAERAGQSLQLGDAPVSSPATPPQGMLA